MMFLAAAKVSMTSEYTCGSTNLIFSGTFPYIVSTVITLIKIAVPILLIVFGMLDLGKAVVASKEDEIKNAQKMLIKRAIYAVAIFFVVLIVQLVFGLLDYTEDSNIEGGSTSWATCWNKY